MTQPPDLIAHDLLCVRCDYNLRTLDRAASCPECNLPVARTLAEDRRNPRILRAPQRIVLAAAILCAADALSLIPVVSDYYVGPLISDTQEAVHYGLLSAALAISTLAVAAAAMLVWRAGPAREPARRGAARVAAIVIAGQSILRAGHAAILASVSYGMYTVAPIPVPRFRLDDYLAHWQALVLPGDILLIVLGFLYFFRIARARRSRLLRAGTVLLLLALLGLTFATIGLLAAQRTITMWDDGDFDTAMGELFTWSTWVYRADAAISLLSVLFYWPLLGVVAWQARRDVPTSASSG